MIRLDYTFDASAQTITFTDPVVEEYLGVIVNRNDGIIIYNSFSPLTTGVLAGQVLTLAYDTSSMADEDVLQIFYADVEKAVSGPLTADELSNLVISTETAPNDPVLTYYDSNDPLPTVIAPELYGRQPAQLSIPVVIANEQVFDLMAPVAVLDRPIAGTITAFQDCLQYRSIAMEIISSAGVSAGVLTFEQSNEISFPGNGVALYLFDDSAITTAPVNTVTLAASTNKFFSGPIKYRYVRVRISTTVAGGQVSVLPVFRMAPYAPITSQVAAAANWSSNVAQLGGTNIVTAGVAGTQSIGGNIAPGVAPTLNPVTIGGVDITRPTPLVRRMVTDIYGHQVLVGPDPNRTDSNPLIATDKTTDLGYINESDVLIDILWEIKLSNSYLKALVEWSAPGIYTDDIESFKQANKF